MSRTDNISPDSTHPGAISMGTELDAANLHLTEMVKAWGGYANSSELTESTSDQIDEAKHSKGSYSKITRYTPDKENIRITVEAILIRRQSSHLLSQLVSRNRYLLSQTAKAEQTMLNPRAISQIPNKGGIVAVADWGAQPLTLDVSWENAHKSVSPYLPDVIAEKEDNTVLLRFSLWAESLIANEKWERTRKSITSYLQRHEILERFNVIAQREDNWDGLESKKPIEESLVRAKRLIAKLLHDILNAGYSWHMFKPLISSDEDGYITVRWRGEGKRLHLLIEEDEMRYIKSWKINNKRKVRSDRTRSDNCFEIWKWLIDG